jgi:hypothetical protein
LIDGNESGSWIYAPFLGRRIVFIDGLDTYDGRGVLSRYTLYVYSLDLAFLIDGMTYENEIYIFFLSLNIINISRVNMRRRGFVARRDDICHKDAQVVSPLDIFESEYKKTNFCCISLRYMESAHYSASLTFPIILCRSHPHVLLPPRFCNPKFIKSYIGAMCNKSSSSYI